jgi:hypothetical protein
MAPQKEEGKLTGASVAADFNSGRVGNDGDGENGKESGEEVHCEWDGVNVWRRILSSTCFGGPYL